MKKLDFHDFDLSPGRSLIEASAGTGKTFSLTKLHLRFVLAGVPVTSILLTTFTEAAAAELRAGARDTLRLALRLADGADIAGEEAHLIRGLLAQVAGAGELLRTALRDLNLAPINSIHGFCHQNIRDGAFFAGQGLDEVRVVENDETLRTSILARIWRAEMTKLVPQAALFLSDHFAEKQEDLLRALEHLGQAGTMLDHSDLRIAIQQLQASDYEEFLNALRSARWKAGNQPPSDLSKLSGWLSAEASVDAAPWSTLASVGDSALVSRLHARDLQKLPREVPQRIDAVLDAFTGGFLGRLAERFHEQRERIHLRDGTIPFDAQIERMRVAVADTDFAAYLRGRYRVAMVDEFQDTDRAQWEIFSRIYPEDSAATLIVIGDPKQAIYGFRGGDVYAYLDAIGTVAPERHYVLDTNYRSSAAAVEAVNTLFDQPQLSFGPPQVVFRPAKARDSLPAVGAGLVVHELGQTTKSELEREALNRLGHDLLRNAAGSVGVLVSTNEQVAAVLRHLAEQGIAASGLHESLLFAEPQALEALLILRALMSGRDFGAALATTLWGADFELLANQREAQTRDFLTYAERLPRLGPGALLEELLLRALPRLRSYREGTRMLTTWRQLIDWVERAEAKHPGHLLEALERAVADPQGEGEKLWVESADARVRVMTYHKSKGLEFDRVWLPYGWWGFKRTPRFPVIADPEGHRNLLLPGPYDPRGTRFEAQWEAEQRRVAYVALTRAREQTSICWGRYKGSTCSPFASLLAAVPQSSVIVTAQGGVPVEAPREQPPASRLIPLPGPRPGWRISSFSAIVHQGADSETRSDEPEPELELELELEPNALRGIAFGNCLHRLLELFDPMMSMQARRAQTRHEIRRFGLPLDAIDEVSTLVSRVASEPLVSGGPSLSELTDADQAREMPFALRHRAGDFSRIEKYLSHLDFDCVQRDPFPRGQLTGVMDLVFRHRERFYVVDYKSNWLGSGRTNYAPERLARVMRQYRYDLQAALYLAALEQNLEACLPDFDPSRHIGGAVYLFVRGLGGSGRSGHFMLSPESSG